MTSHKGVEQAKKIREMGVTFDAISKLVGVSFYYFSTWVTGRRKMPNHQAEKIEWLAVRLEALFDEFRRTWRQPHDNVS